MDSINWLNIQLTPDDLSKINGDIHETIPEQSLFERLVFLILEQFPWEGRVDKIASFHPSQFYENGQWISLPIHDTENVYPPVFQVAQVIGVELADNPIQGSFQVLTLDVNGLQAKLACGIPNAPFPETKIDEFSAEQRIWLAKWIANAYSVNLHATCENYMSNGELQGQFQNGSYIPTFTKIVDTPVELFTEKESSPNPAPQAIYKRVWQKLLLFIKYLLRRGT